MFANPVETDFWFCLWHHTKTHNITCLCGKHISGFVLKCLAKNLEWDQRGGMRFQILSCM